VSRVFVLGKVSTLRLTEDKLFINCPKKSKKSLNN
jgi:hypothetical protein